MVRRRRVVVAAAAVLFVACGASSGSVRGTAACQLTEVPGTSTERDVLSGVGPAGNGIAAAGTRFISAASTGLAVRGSGGSWTATALPKPPATSIEMDDVAGTSLDAWVVGAVDNVAPAIDRWNGHAWVASPIADPGPQEDGLSGIAIGSDGVAWAVGRHEVDTGFRTMVERWDGSTWAEVPSPNAGGSSQLKDVAMTGPDDVWAVGWTVRHRVYRPLVEHWNGARWTVVPTPAPTDGDSLLSGVTATSPRDAWAVGWTSRADVLEPLVEHWDGRSWTLVPIPSDIGHVGLSAVVGTRAGIVVVGRRVTAGNSEPIALLRGATGWVEVPVTMEQPNHGSLTGVTLDRSGNVWAVGTQFSSEGLVSSLVVSGCASS